MNDLKVGDRVYCEETIYTQVPVPAYGTIVSLDAAGAKVAVEGSEGMVLFYLRSELEPAP